MLPRVQFLLKHQACETYQPPFLLMEQSYIPPKRNYVSKAIIFLSLLQSNNALQSLFIPCCIPSSTKTTFTNFHVQYPIAMVALLPPPMSLHLPKIRSCAGLPPLQPSGWRCHSRQKPVTIQLKRKESPFKPLCAGRSHGGPEEPRHPPQFVPLTPLDAVVDDFYTSLNAKDHNRLRELISDDCVFEDLAFPKPFKRKEVHHFLKDLTEAMGKDVKFVIDKVYQGRESSIAVLWHLEWQEKRIPLATGCSFYDCTTTIGGRLLIKKSIVYFESPLKPGVFVLELLKIISSHFDNFPKQAKWFLEKPHAMIQFMTKAYKMLIEPFILPLLVYYTHLWTYGARILCYFLNLLQNLLKIFM